MGKKIFISYRREDASDIAGRIRDWLIHSRRIARDDIFMDVTGILPGADFMRVITDTLRQCRAVIVVISPSWLKHVNSPTTSYVRAETKVALDLGLSVIPVLVGGAKPPSADQLPEELRALTRLNIQPLRHETFDYDMGQVRQALLPGTGLYKSWVAAVAALLLVALILGALTQVPESEANPLWRAFHTGVGSTTGPTPTSSGEVPTATRSATPQPPVVIPENQPLSQTGGALSDNIAVVLDTVTIDYAHQKMLWRFTISNNGTYGLSDVMFTTITLEDPSTRVYTASGQAEDSWNLAPGGSIDKTPTFNFAPQHGVNYTLTLEISDQTYQSFTFTR